ERHDGDDRQRPRGNSGSRLLSLATSVTSSRGEPQPEYSERPSDDGRSRQITLSPYRRTCPGCDGASGGCGPPYRESIHRQDKDRAEDRDDEANGISRPVPSHRPPDESTDESAHDPEAGRENKAARIAPRHQKLGDDTNE